MIKNDIRYIIKRVIIAILIILIMSFIRNTANAETCTLGNEYTNELASVLNSQFSANIGNNAWTVNFNTPIQLNGADMEYVKFYLHYEIRKNTANITNINLQETCSLVDQYSDSQTYTITYADGTSANVYGSDISRVCWNYQVQNGTAIYQWQPNINMVHLVIIRDDDRYIPCDVDSNGIAKCPIEGNHSYKAFRYYMTLSEGTNIPISIGIITRNVPKCTNDNQAIINNQNQNQQQTHQDMQNINNSINNSSVDNSNANSTIQTINNLIPTNNSVSSLISLPITLISSINNGISGSCTGIHLFTIYDYSFTLPCINLAEYLGVTWVIIDTIMSGMLVYAIAKTFIRVFSSLTEMDSNIIKEAYKE